MTEYFLVITEFEAKAKRVYVTTEDLMSRQSCLKLCRDRVHLTSRQRIPGHEVFHVATMGQGTVLQSGYARTVETLCRDSVALCCIATEKAMHARQTRLGAHDKAGAPRLGVHDKGIPSQQIFLCRDRLFTMVKKKKKKDPLGLGPHIWFHLENI